MGLGGTLVVFALSVIFGKDFFSMLGGTGVDETGSPAGEPGAALQRPGANAAEEELVEFVSFVLDDAQATWTRVFPEIGRRPYQETKLVLFTDAVRSGCGFGRAAMGPFYCPEDRKVYIDLGFYRELRSRFGAPGDFAQAYVIAHEIGHHVQNLMGLSERVHEEQRRDPSSAAALSVRLELQADCFAGIWAHSTRQRELLERGDVEEALGAAAAIGDDRIQRQATGRVNPESWTHGSSEQRRRWLMRGMESGRVSECDTYAASRL
jgi:predicted metalloprotease